MNNIIKFTGSTDWPRDKVIDHLERCQMAASVTMPAEDFERLLTQVLRYIDSQKPTSQPVSEPYKLPDGRKLVPFDPAKEMFCFVRDWSTNSPVIPDGSAGTNCIWSTDSDGIWLGDCGVTWQFFDDGPNENGLKYCPSCGKKVSVIAAPAQESE